MYADQLLTTQDIPKYRIVKQLFGEMKEIAQNLQCISDEVWYTFGRTVQLKLKGNVQLKGKIER